MASSTERRDVYQDVTDTILAALEQGTIPWRKPWASAGLQRNADTGRAYTSINQLLLQLSEFGDPRWTTFKARSGWAARSARVRRAGESFSISSSKSTTATSRRQEDHSASQAVHGLQRGAMRWARAPAA